VNGVAATLSGTTFTVSVPLIEGANPITARATKTTGKEGTAGITVTLDTVPPALLSSSPSDGQSGVAATTQIRLTFSESLDPATVVASAFTLQSGSDPAVAVTPALAGAVATLTPAPPLADSKSYALTIAATLADLAGNTLAAPVTIHFTIVDATPPAAPVLDKLTSPICAQTIPVTGTAEPSSTIAVSGGAVAAQGTTGTDGKFSVSVALAPDTNQVLSVTARDASGNTSSPATVSVTTDCTPPQVVSVTPASTTVVVVFTEALAPSSVHAGQTARLDTTGSSPAPIAATSSLSQDGTTLTLTVTGVDLGNLGYALTLTSGITDVAGNALAPYTKTFTPKATVLLGEVYDDAIGRPMANAVATVLASGGVPTAAPRPSATVTQNGTFSLAILPGDAVVKLSAPGYLDVFRRQTIDAGSSSGAALSATMFDARLTPVASPAAASSTSSGTGYSTPFGAAQATLTAPAGSLASGTAVLLTVRRPQGLPVLSPLGWSVAAAAHVTFQDGSGASVSPSGSMTLALPDFFGASSSTALVFAQLDPVGLQWIDGGAATLDSTTSAITFPISAAGDYAVFVADPDPTSPPDAFIGSPLAGAILPDQDPLQSATVLANPVDVLPSQTATVSLKITSAAPVPSGFPIQTLITETLTLIDGSQVSAP
jgi:hypothetical protein